MDPLALRLQRGLRRDVHNIRFGKKSNNSSNVIDEPLKEFERVLETFATETTVNSNQALDAVANQIFPTNAYAL